MKFFFFIFYNFKSLYIAWASFRNGMFYTRSVVFVLTEVGVFECLKMKISSFLTLFSKNVVVVRWVMVAHGLLVSKWQ